MNINITTTFDTKPLHGVPRSPSFTSLCCFAMDEVDVALLISDAIKDLKQQFNLLAMAFDAKMDALANILNWQSEAVNSKIDFLLSVLHPSLPALFAPSTSTKITSWQLLQFS
ncbi:hypothetical protein GCK32_001697 [Trichostrongylus colubriformis]|uniref:Uncharacterized protein n=1 Tax=Trichostrongylus colubriformis TaxID=6319 RepID=A0AAN8J2R5_TRICO